MKTGLYEVEIERLRNRILLERQYRCRVRVWLDAKSWEDEELGARALAYTLQGAKKKALKHILKTQKDLDKGIAYGIVFKNKGDVETIKKSLES